MALACLAFSASTALAAGPLDAFNGLKGNLDIAGGTAHIPVMKGAAKQIMAANPDIRITVAGGGSGVGVQKAGEGLAQIGNTGRALKESEIKKYGLVSFPFAIDGVAKISLPVRSPTGKPWVGLTRPFRFTCARTAAEPAKPSRNALWTREVPLPGPTWSIPTGP